MQGKLKNDRFFEGNRTPISMPDKGKLVTLTHEENHPIFGKRFKISGYDQWFEANCFEYIKY